MASQEEERALPEGALWEEEELRRWQEEAWQELARADSPEALERVRVAWLGRRGRLSGLLRRLGEVPPEERPRLGQMVNRLRDSLAEALAERAQVLAREAEAARLEAERLDVTLPGVNPGFGCPHPLLATWDAIVDVFRSLGFSVVDGPEVESDYYNFEALNIPADHPARDMQDSFYVEGGWLLRTHTSPVQIRTMQRTAPATPLRVVAPGRVYRRDDDVTHSPVFHQVEGLVVDEEVSLGHLKGTLAAFAEGLFGPGTSIRLRPSYFPFTEPSVEVDVSCLLCGQRGCRVCKGTGWLEVLGAGMVHPRVLRSGGYDPARVQGFAFGLGIDRVAMLLYGLEDVRLLFHNDLRLLRRLSGVASQD